MKVRRRSVQYPVHVIRMDIKLGEIFQIVYSPKNAVSIGSKLFVNFI